MKILIICDLPHNLSDVKGGVESSTINLINGIVKLNHDINLTILSFSNQLEKDITVILSEKCSILYYKENLSLCFIQKLRYRNKILKKIYEEIGPDLIHFQGSGPYILMLTGLPKQKILVTIHGILKRELMYQSSIKSTISFIIKAIIDNFYTKNLLNFIFVSKYTQYQILNNNKKKNKIVIYNSVNPKFISNSNLTINNSIIYIGVISKLKNCILILDSIKHLKTNNINFKLNIIGDSKSNKYNSVFLKKIKALNIGNSVSLWGWQDQNNIASLISKSMIFILPSFQENMPMSIIEAMANGKIVIASNVGGISEIIKDGINGFLINPHSSIDLTNLLYRINVMGIEDLLSISNNAKYFATTNFLPEIIAQQTINFYKTILSNE